MDPDPSPKSWWHTLPGLLTAAAGAITAVTALLTALHQAGWLGQSAAPAAPPSAATAAVATASPSASTTLASATPPAPVANPSSALRVQLPEQVELVADTLSYRILGAQLLPQNPGQRSLKFRIRIRNNGRYDANFWSASFRLQAGDQLLAPVNELNELVPGNSTMEGPVEFTVPDSLAQAQLQMGTVGAGVAAITVGLQSGP